MRKQNRRNMFTSLIMIICLSLTVFFNTAIATRAEGETTPGGQTEPGAGNGSEVVTVPDTEAVTVDANEPQGVTLDITTRDISPGESFTLTPTLTPTTATTTYTWNSSQSSYATVDSNGLVKGVAIGSTDITVTTANGKTASCHVNVRQKNYTQLLFEDDEIKIKPDEIETITGEVYPTDAINTEIIWESTNTEIATVERDSKKYRKAYVHGLKVGKCRVIAKNKDGQEIGSIKVRVGSPTGLEKMKNVKASKVTISELKRGKGQFKVKYAKITDASGYQIKYRKSGKWIIVETTKRSFTAKKLPKGTYKVKVRAFRKYEGKKYYGHFSKSQKIKVK